MRAWPWGPEDVGTEIVLTQTVISFNEGMALGARGPFAG